jgi:TatD DNase family protein
MIDSHAHLEMLDNPEESLKRSLDAGIEAILTIIDPTENASKALELAENYGFVWFACGVHPHNARYYSEKIENLLEELTGHPKCLAVGEIGLDFHYNYSAPDIQRFVFKKQLELAERRNLPVVIHTREAFKETAEILDLKHKNWERVLFHCFSGDKSTAEFAIGRGASISFAGNVTYPKAEKLRCSAEYVPLERMLIETDCPFLAPQPVRGKKNEPAYIVHTYEFIASLKKVSIEQLKNQISRNFKVFFGC